MSSEMVLTRDASSATPSVPAEQHAPGRPIRVVYVIDNMGIGGTELNAVRTAERLDRQHFELQVVCLKGDGPLTQRYRDLGVPVVNLGLRSFYGPSMLTTGIRFVRFLRRTKPDVVHAHDVYSNIFVTVWARLAGARSVIASRRWWHSLPNRKLQLGNRFAFARADVVLANSGQVARSVAEEARVPQSRIATITNFVDEAAFQAMTSEERASLRSSWNVPPHAIVIGCVARLVPVKNHQMLLRAFAKLREAVPDLHLVLIGDGSARSSLEQLALELGVADGVHFTGELRDGANHHRALDISVLCSASEGFPNTLVEAMAAGRPVVATAVGGSSDAVVDGETGFLVPSGDVDALTASLHGLVRDPALRSTFGMRGQERARLVYHEDRVLKSVEELYERLAEAAA